MKIILLLLVSVSHCFGQKARIVGGSSTDITQVPYQVSLQYKSSHYCGGSIISSSYILSAAHCVSDNNINLYSIRMGSSYHDSGGTLTSLSAIIKHPSYKASKENFDFSLLRLKSQIKEFSSTINVIKLPGNEQYQANTTAIVSGWGASKEGGSSVRRLQILEIPLVSKSLCSRRYPNEITSQMICAGFLTGGKDSCQGNQILMIRNLCMCLSKFCTSNF